MKQLYENELYPMPQLDIHIERNPFPLHYHHHLEIQHIISGELGVHTGGKTEYLHDGDTLFIAPYEVHGYAPPPPTGKPRVFRALLDPECLGLAGKALLDHRPKKKIIRAEELLPHYPDCANKLAALVSRMNIETSPDTYPADFAEFVNFLSVLLKITGVEQSENKTNSLFIKAVRLCCDNYADRSFCLDTLSSKMFVSRARLEQLFSQNLDLGVKEYITLLRLSKAESYLCETSLSIQDIAFKCGYSTVRSFNRAFLRIHGTTPSEYRKAHKDNSSAKAHRKILSNFDLFYKIDTENNEIKPIYD